jgi:hypothetical protein
MQWLRKAADNGHGTSCLKLAKAMYLGQPHAREIGHVVEAAGDTTYPGVIEGFDVPPDVLNSVLRWVHRGPPVHGIDPVVQVRAVLGEFRRIAVEGDKYCYHEGCEVVGLLKDFKRCPQCKAARYWAMRVRNKTGRPVGTR